MQVSHRLGTEDGIGFPSTLLCDFLASLPLRLKLQGAFCFCCCCTAVWLLLLSGAGVAYIGKYVHSEITG